MAPTWPSPDVGCLVAKVSCSGKWSTLSLWLQSWRGQVLQNEASELRKGKWLVEVAQHQRHRLGLEPSAPHSPGFDFPGLSLDRKSSKVTPSKRSLSGGRDMKKGCRPYGS